MKRLILFACMIILTLTTVSAADIFTTHQAWQIQKHDNIQYDYFNVTIEDMENYKAKICFYPKEEMKSNSPIIDNLRVTIKQNEIQTRQVEPSYFELS